MQYRFSTLRRVLTGVVCICSLLLLCPAARAWAHEQGEAQPEDLTELSIQDLMNVTVYGASKFDQTLSEAPSSVSIVTSDEIKKYGYRTLADVLKSERSFYVRNDRNYSYVGVRGFDRLGDFNTRILLLVDGHRTNDNIYNQAYFGTEFHLDIDLIDKIEVIRGPSSSIYGTNAFFAVINIITKKGRDLSGVEASAAAGSLDTYNGRISAGNKFPGGAEALISGSIMDSKGNHRLYYPEFDSPATNNGIAENGDYDRSYSLFSKVSLNDFALEGVFSSRTKGIPTASYGTIFNDTRNQTIDERGYLDLKYEHDLGDRSRIMARVYYDHMMFDGTYMFDAPPITAFKNLNWGEWWGGELQVTTAALTNNKIVGGLEYEDNIRQQQKNIDEEPYWLYLDDKRSSKRLAAYVQDELALSKYILLNAGVRYDRYETFGNSTNPRISIMYNPLVKTTLKFLYGTAFRAPNVFELYYDDNGLFQKANPDLKPEKIITYELVLEQFIGESMRGSVSGFQYRTKDLITMEVDPADNLKVFRNTGRVTTNGFELELEKIWKNGIKGRTSYTVQEARDDETKELAINSPRQLAKFNLMAPIMDKLFVGLEEQYTGRRKTLGGNYAGEFFITNLTLFSRNLAQGLELSGSIYNLFDKKYGDPGSTEHTQDIIEQDGRTYRVKLTCRY